MTIVKRKLTRGDCLKEQRPCQRHCPYRLDGAESCALDVADRGGTTLVEIASLLGVGKERARQIEEDALVKLCAGLGVPVPHRKDYQSEREGCVRDGPAELDEAVFCALLTAERATSLELSSAAGRCNETVRASLGRLLADDRVVQIRLPSIQRSYAYEVANREDAD